MTRFGLQILRAVIETAPPVGDGIKGLPGIFQAPDIDGDWVTPSVNEDRRGRKVDEQAMKQHKVFLGSTAFLVPAFVVSTLSRRVLELNKAWFSLTPRPCMNVLR